MYGISRCSVKPSGGGDGRELVAKKRKLTPEYVFFPAKVNHYRIQDKWFQNNQLAPSWMFGVLEG